MARKSKKKQQHQNIGGLFFNPMKEASLYFAKIRPSDNKIDANLEFKIQPGCNFVVLEELDLSSDNCAPVVKGGRSDDLDNIAMISVIMHYSISTDKDLDDATLFARMEYKSSGRIKGYKILSGGYIGWISHFDLDLIKQWTDKDADSAFKQHKLQKMKSLMSKISKKKLV